VTELVLGLLVGVVTGFALGVYTTVVCLAGAKKMAGTQRAGEATISDPLRARLPALVATWRKGDCYHGVRADCADEVAALLREPPEAADDVLNCDRLRELCRQFDIAETDTLKHRLEDWERWDAEHRALLRDTARPAAPEGK
jgi:hypothetical protein